MNVITVARIGNEVATAVFPERISSSLRTYLGNDSAQILHIIRGKTAHFISFFLISTNLFKNGISHAKNLITLMPESSSWMSFTRVSVNFMLLVRAVYDIFRIQLWMGIPRRNKEKPARALGPRLTKRMTRAMIIWTLVDHVA